MYNRYIPQEDGTYRRNRVSTPVDQKETGKLHNIESFHASGVPQELPCTEQPVSAGSFLKKLLPKNLDTGDLLVIVLLLLMAGDCKEEKNSALLTLALYLFL